jgi:ABC-2 type transport system permease protein
MLELFKIEWLKVKTYRTFWVLLGGFILFFPLAFYFIAYQFMKEAATREAEMLKSLMGNPFIFPRVWLSSAYFGGMFFIMIGMLFILLITNEVQYRTHRQNIIDGWSRMDFLKAKFSMLIFFVLLSSVLVFLMAILVGSIHSTGNYNILDGVHYLGYYALMATAYLVVAYLIAILVKRTGLAIIIYFAFVAIVDNLLWIILTLHGRQIGYFLPLESTDSLVPNPFMNASVLMRRTVSDNTLAIVGAGYIVLLCYLLIKHFKRIDLKT